MVTSFVISCLALKTSRNVAAAPSCTLEH